MLGLADSTVFFGWYLSIYLSDILGLGWLACCLSGKGYCLHLGIVEESSCIHSMVELG